MTTVKLTVELTEKYADDHDFRRGLKKGLFAGATLQGEDIELHDCEGFVLEVFVPEPR